MWLHLTAGQGPAECGLAVRHAAGRMLEEARRAGLAAALLEEEPFPGGPGLASALVSLEGEGAERFAAGWVGTLQWVCPSPLRPGHGRKNWFIGVSVLGAKGYGPAEMDPRDVVVETMRAGGAGGQHQNKTESAVRATHRPTGLTAIAREERSQHRNRQLALARLRARLAGLAEQERAGEKEERWRRHTALTRGNPVRVFTGPDFLPG